MKVKVFAILDCEATSHEHATAILEEALRCGVATIEVFDLDDRGLVKPGPPAYRYGGANYGTCEVRS